MKRFLCVGMLAVALAGCGGGGGVDEPKEEPVTLLDQVVTYSEGITSGDLFGTAIIREFSPPGFMRPPGKTVEVCAEGTITQKLRQSGAFSLGVYMGSITSPASFVNKTSGTAGVDLVFPFKLCGNGGGALGLQFRADNCGAAQCTYPFGGYAVTARWTAKTVP